MVALNLALELSKHGKIGLLDIDIDSANLYEALGMDEKLGLTEERRIIPMEHNGMKIFSMGGFLSNHSLGISMTGQSMKQIIEDAINVTEWGDTDYLIVDAPAGTSRDKFLAVKEALGEDLIGIVLVTQPNIIEDVRRMVDLCARHRIRILGLVENMGGMTCSQGHTVTCPDCGEIVNPLGTGGGEDVAREYGITFFGRIPLSPAIRHGLENGNPEIPEEFKPPIKLAVEKILKEEPKKKGTLMKIKEKVL
ncbi:P-loop NTPase [Candidatus Pacearchaeota archaeon]|nr:P-loop NTPase [Candidatus Pacearchaeota archaeon]